MVHKLDLLIFKENMNKLSIRDRINNLFSGIPPTPSLNEAELSAPAKGITIRFQPDVRKFIDHQSENIGCSVQELVNMAMCSIMVATDTLESSELELMCSRFRIVFSAYGIGVFDIPDFLESNDISLSDLMDDKLLIDKLSFELLRKIATTFNIDIEWLLGKSNYPIPYGSHYRWYKNIGGVIHQIAKYKRARQRINVMFVVKGSNNFFIDKLSTLYCGPMESYNSNPQVGVVIERTSRLGRNDFSVYDCLPYESWAYDKCRLQLKLLMMFCIRTNTEMCGISLSDDLYKKLYSEGALPADIFNKRQNLKSWSPQKLLLNNEEENPEHKELSTVDYYYENNASDYCEASIGSIKTHEKAVKEPWKLKDQEGYFSGVTIEE